MIFIPACFDRESRGEFWRYAGKTFQFYRGMGASADEARCWAIRETNKHINACIKYTKRAAQ
jgi:hypothetical protein